jgi:membrane protease YdiL (CAAX protease family)
MTPAMKTDHEPSLPVGKYREMAAFVVAGLVILLRLTSDWLFAQGGPLWYQGVQAALLVVAVLLLWPSLGRVFLKGGDNKASIKEGLIAVPLGIAFGLLGAFALYHGLTPPSTDQALTVIGNNLFFPAVEELEFRGFMLAWLLGKNVSPGKAIVITVLIHVLAHPHRAWNGQYYMLVLSLIVFLWYGSLVVRTRSLWGAYVTHASFNIFGFLPTVSHGMR